MTQAPAADIVDTKIIRDLAALPANRRLEEQVDEALVACATEIEALRAREAELRQEVDAVREKAVSNAQARIDLQRKLDKAVKALEVISAKVEPEANRSNWEQIAMQDIEFATSALASIRGETD